MHDTIPTPNMDSLFRIGTEIARKLTGFFFVQSAPQKDFQKFSQIQRRFRLERANLYAKVGYSLPYDTIWEFHSCFEHGSGNSGYFFVQLQRKFQKFSRIQRRFRLECPDFLSELVIPHCDANWELHSCPKPGFSV